MKNAYILELFGVIQGVGFRPFVYRLATTMNLSGYVQNRYHSLYIYIEATKKQSEEFLHQVLYAHPPNAMIQTYTMTQVPISRSYSDFQILHSHTHRQNEMFFLPQDSAICKECLEDMGQEGRFKDYAFSTCSHCGARHSIIHALPYDRDRTSMCDFPKCQDCESEYHDVANRRFHAEPISCNHCAIRMRLIIPHARFSRIYAYPHARNDILLLAFLAHHLMAGKIVAIKGVGGFNLIASADNIGAIRALKQRKNRPHKPFAIMFKNLQDIASVAQINEAEQRALLSPQAPIVLLQKSYEKGGILSQEALELIAPQVASIGAILPYNGIMHLLFRFLRAPLVFTSANLSGEPIITQTEELMSKLSGVFDMVLDYSREILHALDDSIVRFMAGEMRPLRIARGYAPLFLPTQSQEMCLGVGAQQKSSISIMYKNTMISHYFGDLHSVDSIKRLRSELAFFLELYEIKPSRILCDLHPQYASSMLAGELARDIADSSLGQISHHKAHFYAILAEAQSLSHDAFGIIWDGTGLGEDGSIWGGEGFLYNSSRASMQRIYHFKPFALVGGEGSIKEIGRLALGLLWSYDIAEDMALEGKEILASAYKNGAFLQTSSVGRLIDAVAYLLGILKYQSYEGQSGALLESYALRVKDEISPYPFHIENNVIMCQNMIEEILRERDRGRGAKRFLETLAYMALYMSEEVRKHREVSVFFSGGVFQNKFLCDRIHALFQARNIPFYMHKKLPCNDSNISFGQAVYGSVRADKEGEDNERE